MQPVKQPTESNGQKRSAPFGKLLLRPIPFQHEQLKHQDSNSDALSDDVAAHPTMRYTTIPQTPQELWPYEELDAQFEDAFDTSRMSTVRLMELSGMLQAIHVSPSSSGISKINTRPDLPWTPPDIAPPSTPNIDEYADRNTLLLQVPQAATVVTQETTVAKQQSKLKVFINKPVVKVGLGLLVGVLMLVLVSRVVDIPKTVHVLRTNLTTPRGLLFAILTVLSFVAAFSIRGMRWNMFLRPITNISIIKCIRIYWVGVFINVLLPVQGGEVAKSLLLKRLTGVPISVSLPTVAMDKALDLMPALIIMAIVPFIPGIHMSITLWLILGLVGGILIGLIFTVTLTAINRKTATAFIQFMIRLLPKGIGSKIEGFAMGFIDSLLAGASRPKTFIPAVVLTLLAISCDGLFAMFAFWTVGVTNMGFGMAIFGYTVFNMFCILPNPPGQVGSNEIIGPLVFSGLLGFDKSGVLAMFIFSHPLTALTMASMCFISLSSLGLKLSSAIKPQSSGEKGISGQTGMQKAVEKQIVMA